jgi:flagellin-like protein
VNDKNCSSKVEKLQKIMKNKKAISPVLAVLLMIAVAVAAALITYAWVMTYLSSTTSRAGHAIQIQSVDFTGNAVYVQNVGDGTVIVSEIYQDGALLGTALELTIFEGETQPVSIAGTTWAPGTEYHFKVVCDDGSFTEGTYTA